VSRERTLVAEAGLIVVEMWVCRSAGMSRALDLPDPYQEVRGVAYSTLVVEQWVTLLRNRLKPYWS